MKKFTRARAEVIALRIQNEEVQGLSDFMMDVCGMISRSLIIFTSFVQDKTSSLSPAGKKTDVRSTIIKMVMKMLGMCALRIYLQVIF